MQSTVFSNHLYCTHLDHTTKVVPSVLSHFAPLRISKKKKLTKMSFTPPTNKAPSSSARPQQPPPRRVTVPPNIQEILPEYAVVLPSPSSQTNNVISTPSAARTVPRPALQRIQLPENLKQLFHQNPNMTITNGRSREKIIYDFFCHSVRTGNANFVYGIQSNSMVRFDLNKTIVIQGLTALQTAAASGHTDLLRVLFHFGASASIMNKAGHTALHCALARHNSCRFRNSPAPISDVAMLIGYTQFRARRTNGIDTFVSNDLRQLREPRNQHFVVELNNKYPEFRTLRFA